MIQLTLNPTTETKVKRIAQNYRGGYDGLFDDMILFYQNELKKSIRTIERDFGNFEQTYNMSSQEFYEKFSTGELGDDNDDFLQWAGEYEIWQDQKQELEALAV